MLLMMPPPYCQMLPLLPLRADFAVTLFTLLTPRRLKAAITRRLFSAATPLLIYAIFARHAITPPLRCHDAAAAYVDDSAISPRHAAAAIDVITRRRCRFAAYAD